MIHTGKLQRIEIYHNTRGETPEAIKARTGCNTIISGIMFNGDGSLCGDIRKDGIWLRREGNTTSGIGWSGNEVPKAVQTKDAEQYANFLTCFEVQNTIKRGRGAVGFRGNTYTAFGVSDSTNPMTIPEVHAVMKARCDVYLILDGGGSVYLDSPTGIVGTSHSRKTQNRTYLLIWEDNEVGKEDKKKMLIALDAGHGMNTAGKRCMKTIDPNETREWFLNDRISRYAEGMLAAYDCEVMRLDDRTGKTDVPLATRVQKANDANADVLASIHHNAGINGGSGGGICVFAAVNGSATSDKLQKEVYKHTVEKTGLRGNRWDGVPDSNLYVIYKSKMPAFLGEFGFMDSVIDVPIILTEDFAKKCAEGIVLGLVEVLGLVKKPVEPEKPTGNTRYRVMASNTPTQMGSFSIKENAEALKKDLEDKGYVVGIREVKI